MSKKSSKFTFYVVVGLVLFAFYNVVTEKGLPDGLPGLAKMKDFAVELMDR